MSGVALLNILTAIHIVLLAGLIVFFMRLFGFMALIAPKAWWRGWAAENRGDRKNPYRFGTWDHAAWREGYDVSNEVDPGKKPE